MTRGSVLVVGCAAALTGCFQGDFLRNTCEQQGGCAGASSSSSSSSGSSGPPTTSDGTSTSTSTSTSTGASSEVSGTTEPSPGVPYPGVVFRINTIEIVDPNLYYSGLSCLEATGFVNTAMQKSLIDRDSNVLLAARDYDPTLEFQLFEMYRDADCPIDKDYCLTLDTVIPVKFLSGNRDDLNCLDVEQSTINPDNLNTLNFPKSPCVSSPNAAVELQLSPDLSPIKFYDGKFSAQYNPDDDNPDGLISAILYGFIPRADAEAIVYKFMGAEIKFWSVVRGTTDPASCPLPMDGAPGSVPDADMLDLDGDGPGLPVEGIYLYLNFTAERVDLYLPF